MPVPLVGDGRAEIVAGLGGGAGGRAGLGGGAGGRAVVGHGTEAAMCHKECKNQ